MKIIIITWKSGLKEAYLANEDALRTICVSFEDVQGLEMVDACLTSSWEKSSWPPESVSLETAAALVADLSLGD